MRFRKDRKFEGVVLALAIAALLLGGAPARAAAEPGGTGLMDWAWGWVRSLWEEADNSMAIDPDGLAVSGPKEMRLETSNNSMAIDPNGLDASGPDGTPRETSDNSMHIDPNG